MGLVKGYSTFKFTVSYVTRGHILFRSKVLTFAKTGLVALLLESVCIFTQIMFYIWIHESKSVIISSIFCVAFAAAPILLWVMPDTAR